MQASCVGEVARGAATALCLLHLVGGSAKRTKVALDGGRGCLRLALVAGIALRSPGDISRPALLAALAQREALRVGVLTRAALDARVLAERGLECAYEATFANVGARPVGEGARCAQLTL